MARKYKVVQAGVNTSAGNGIVPNSPTLVPTVKMPVQPRNKPWIPDWHPAHPLNQSSD